MLAVVVIVVVVLAISGLALYAMRNKVRLKVNATALKLFSFNIEVNSAEETGDLKQLPPGSGIADQPHEGVKGRNAEGWWGTGEG